MDTNGRPLQAHLTHAACLLGGWASTALCSELLVPLCFLNIEAGTFDCDFSEHLLTIPLKHCLTFPFSVLARARATAAKKAAPKRPPKKVVKKAAKRAPAKKAV